MIQRPSPLSRCLSISVLELRERKCSTVIRDKKAGLGGRGGGWQGHMWTLSSHLDGPTICSSALRYAGVTPPAAAAAVAHLIRSKPSWTRVNSTAGAISQTQPRRSDTQTPRMINLWRLTLTQLCASAYNGFSLWYAREKRGEEQRNHTNFWQLVSRPQQLARTYILGRREHFFGPHYEKEIT